MITLSDYLGYIFIEITNARINADHYAAAQAKEYAKDDVMKHFSIPRFKIPEMDLNIPVLIAGAKFKSTIEFNMEEEEFTTYIQDLLNKAEQSIYIKVNGVKNVIIDFTKVIKPIVVKPIVVNPVVVRGALKADNAPPLIKAFYTALKENPNPTMPENIIDIHLEGIFKAMITEKKLTEDYKKYYPKNELYLSMNDTVTEKVKSNTIVVKNKIENLLVNPETQMVKEGSGEFSVFQIKAKVNEEGVFINTINEEDGTEKAIVDFE